jgi:hypothetical protein
LPLTKEAAAGPPLRDISPVRDALSKRVPSARLIEVGYLESTELFAGGKP